MSGAGPVAAGATAPGLRVPEAADGFAGRFPVPDFLRHGAPAAVLAALPGARAVGGCVRDALAGRAVADVDVGVPLPPDEAAARLRAAGLRVVETGLAHGTVTAILRGEPVEVTSLRRDVDTDGRHAVVAWTTDWREDAARRDFTINALSMDADGGLWDFHGGRADLAAGVVRFVGDAATRLREDYLRALRFFRFHARYGRGAPDPAALAAIRDAVPGLARLSIERVWSELRRLLAAPDPTGALALMRDAGVLEAILPEADPARLFGLADAVAAGMPADPVARLAALLPGAAAAAAAIRLRASNEDRADLERLAAAPAIDPATDGDALRRALFRAGSTVLAERAAWVAQARDGADRDALRRRMVETALPVFPVGGRDALALGARPGPAMGQLLRDVEAWWLERGCRDDAGPCRAELARRLNNEGTGQ